MWLKKLFQKGNNAIKWIFHSTGAAGNVFATNQARLGKIWSWFQTSGALKTVSHYLIFLALTAPIDILRTKSINFRRQQMETIKKDPSKAAEAINQFLSSWTKTLDVFDSIGNGISNGNALLLPFTLFNVYYGNLDHDGAIQDDSIYYPYLGSYILSILFFLGTKYTNNADESQKLAKELLQEIKDKSLDIEQNTLRKLEAAAGLEKNDEETPLLINYSTVQLLL